MTDICSRRRALAQDDRPGVFFCPFGGLILGVFIDWGWFRAEGAHLFPHRVAAQRAGLS